MKNLLLLAALMFSFGLSAQRLEVGATTAAAIGIGYGTFYDIRPMVAWGKSFESVRRVRLDRTSMNFSDRKWVRVIMPAPTIKVQPLEHITAWEVPTG